MSSAGVPVEAGTPSPHASRASARSHKRSALVSLGWTFRDYAKRVWDNSSEDNVLFLAGGIAFNILLAAVPFVLLLIAGVTYLLPVLYRGKVDSSQAVAFFIDRLLPAHGESPTSPIHKLITDIIRTRKSFTIYGAIGFIWFSTRLFGSLRTVLADVFDIEHERGIIQGKLFDIQLTIVATLLFVASTALNTYLSIVTRSGVQFLGRLGLQHDVMGGLEYWTGRALAFVFIAWMFFALYKYLPIRRVRWRSAWTAALFTSALFEAARWIFSAYVRTFNPGSLYTGTLTAIVIIVFWTYYAALIFILGGEVGQVYELRRMRRLQREVFSEG
ncbi:MAG TPA: YihY/virulence factor BrkB family protein [Gemmatimonadaceae bacterium]|nr:YihY/virulence factor BrkB family protein [Gemmatimonadaceae bacterium]